MKAPRYILIVSSLTFALTSCKSSKTVNANKLEDSEKVETTTNNQTANVDTMSDYGSEKLFADLNMTDNQILMFRKGMKEFKQLQVSTPNGEMMGSLEDEQGRQLKSILSEEQFEIYQKLQDTSK
ncbi:hypothetical protein [Aurantibacter sp.]|uniref:hypothetical protein n=1 Tax=Aurantibacter sp. TaxID=2807103 RepID=UPI0032639B0D